MMILLILVWSSIMIAGEAKSNCTKLEFMDNDAELVYTTKERSCRIEADLKVICSNVTHFKAPDITPKSISCGDMSTVQTNSSQTATVTSIGLGVVVGILIVLLVIVSAGWMWTCWIVKRQGRRIAINSRDINNLSYDNNQPTLQTNLHPIQTPNYETIPPLSMDGIKLDLEPKEKGCDSGNNREEVYHRLNRAQRDDKKRESKDQIHKSGQYQGKERVTELSSGTSLQEIQHSSANTSTEVLLDTAVPSEEGQSASPVDIGKTPQENETVNSSVKKNDRELDGTTQEHNHNQTEMSKKEEDLPKKRAAGSMRNKRTNSEQIRNSMSLIENQINPCYNQPTLAIYESIPSHKKQDNNREGGKQGEGSYDVLNREQFGTVVDPEMIHKEVKTCKLELADSKIKFENNPAYATTTQSDM